MIIHMPCPSCHDWMNLLSRSGKPLFTQNKLEMEIQETYRCKKCGYQEIRAPEVLSKKHLDRTYPSGLHTNPQEKMTLTKKKVKDIWETLGW